nr:unnamed protein product [Digitaria exilis]
MKAEPRLAHLGCLRRRAPSLPSANLFEPFVHASPPGFGGVPVASTPLSSILPPPLAGEPPKSFFGHEGTYVM